MKIELRWVIMLVTLTFGVVFQLTYNLLTGTHWGILAYIPYLVSISYAVGVERGLVIQK